MAPLLSTVPSPSPPTLAPPAVTSNNRSQISLPEYQRCIPDRDSGEPFIGPLLPQSFPSISCVAAGGHNLEGTYMVKLSDRAKGRDIFDANFRTSSGNINAAIYIENHVKRHARVGAFSESGKAAFAIISRESPIKITVKSVTGSAAVSLPRDFDGLLKISSGSGEPSLSSPLKSRADLVGKKPDRDFGTYTYRIRPDSSSTCPSYPPRYTRPILSCHNKRVPSWVRRAISFMPASKGDKQGTDRATVISVSNKASACFWREES